MHKKYDTSVFVVNSVFRSASAPTSARSFCNSDATNMISYITYLYITYGNHKYQIRML